MIPVCFKSNWVCLKVIPVIVIFIISFTIKFLRLFLQLVNHVVWYSMKDIDAIKALLQQANNLMIDNIDKADNIDLEYMSQKLDQMIDDLTEIKDFEKFEE